MILHLFLSLTYCNQHNSKSYCLHMQSIYQKKKKQKHSSLSIVIFHLNCERQFQITCLIKEKSVLRYKWYYVSKCYPLSSKLFRIFTCHLIGNKSLSQEIYITSVLANCCLCLHCLILSSQKLSSNYTGTLTNFKMIESLDVRANFLPLIVCITLSKS